MNDIRNDSENGQLMHPLILTFLTVRYLYCLFAASDYGLFLSDEDPKKGIWLEAGKALDYYMLRNGVSVEYFINLKLFIVSGISLS